MLMPSIFGENLLDDFFGKSPFNNYGVSDLMKTDIKDNGQAYEIAINMPGFQKEDIKAELKDGYLTISASANQIVHEENEKGHYIRKERYSGSCSRSFYVGNEVTQEEIKAKYNNGILLLTVPKKETKAAIDQKRYIAIDGE